MGWGEKESLAAQIGALRTQLDIAERKHLAAEQRASAWRDVHHAHLATLAAADLDDDAPLDAAIEVLKTAIDVAEGLEP